MQKNINSEKVTVNLKRTIRDSIEEHLLKSEEDIRNGKTRDAREVFKEWKQQYEL